MHLLYCLIWERLTSGFYFSCFLPFLDRWMTSAHQPSKGKKKSPRLSLNLCVAFPFLLWSFLGYHPPQSPVSHFPFLFLLFRASLSLSLKNLYSDFLFMIRWRFKYWRGFQNSQISQFLKLNIILKLEK